MNILKPARCSQIGTCRTQLSAIDVLHLNHTVSKRLQQESLKLQWKHAGRSQASSPKIERMAQVAGGTDYCIVSLLELKRCHLFNCHPSSRYAATAMLLAGKMCMKSPHPTATASYTVSSLIYLQESPESQNRLLLAIVRSRVLLVDWWLMDM